MKHLSLSILLAIFLQSNVLSVSSEDAYSHLQNFEFPVVFDEEGNVEDDIVNEGPLFLTPMIEKNQINEARAAAEVTHTDFKNVKSYSGLLTVDKHFGSHMFFWYYPAPNEPKAPVILWLQGGPGESGLFGLFNEHGPYVVDENYELQSRNGTWILHHNIIYIDNPVGTGFSFTNHELGLSCDIENIVFNLYEALSQLFKLFPELQPKKFYVCGDAYAGKFVTALAHSIMIQNDREGGLQINLKGIAMGNGLVNPLAQFNYRQNFYMTNSVDNAGSNENFRGLEGFVHDVVRRGNYEDAFSAFQLLMMTTNEHPESPSKRFVHFLNRPEIRRAVHVGGLEFVEKSKVAKHMARDLFKSEDEHLIILLEVGVRVLFYNGAWDQVVSYNATNKYLMSLNWSCADEFRRSPRKEWRVAGQFAGYAKEGGNLKEVLVLNAGHHVSADQPFRVWDLITDFTYDN